MLRPAPTHILGLIALSLVLPSIASVGALSAEGGRTYSDGQRGDVYFPLGDISFADEVVLYEMGDPPPRGGKGRNANDILGVPDYDQDGHNFLTLGCNGTVILGFGDNAVVDLDGPDLYVFEIGPDVEPTNLWISTNAVDWIDIGRISGGRADVDIGPYTPAGGVYRYVKLRDLGSACGSRTPGADIDAVGAIGSAVRLTLASAVLFDFDKAALKSSARPALDEAARQIDAYPDAQVVIIGHTDSKGAENYNVDLSLRRADTVAKYLSRVSALDSTKWEIRGAGEHEPVATNSDDTGRARNRRVEIAIIPPRDAAVADLDDGAPEFRDEVSSSAVSDADAIERLRKLKAAFDEGLIDQAQYEMLRQQILSEF